MIFWKKYNTLELGVLVAGKHKSKDNFKEHYKFSDYSFRPSLRLGVLRNLDVKGQEQELQFIAGGDKMNVIGTNLVEDIYSAKAGIEIYERGSGSTMNINYKYEMGSGYDGHFGSLEYRKLF